MGSGRVVWTVEDFQHARTYVGSGNIAITRATSKISRLYVYVSQAGSQASSHLEVPGTIAIVKYHTPDRSYRSFPLHDVDRSGYRSILPDMVNQVRT